MTAKAVLVNAGRSVVTPDGPGFPETASQVLGGLVGAVLERSGIDPSDVDALFLSEPRHLAADSVIGRQVTNPPFDVRTRVHASSAVSLERAVEAIEHDPTLVVVVAASDFGAGESGAHAGDRDNGSQPAIRRSGTGRWGVCAEDVLDWARSSYARSSECSRAGDFAREIVVPIPGYIADSFPPMSTAVPRPARGASAVVLTSAERAAELGVRYRAGLGTASYVAPSTEGGVEPLDTQAFKDLLAPCGVDAAQLDQLEVPEYDPAVPLGWIKTTGISPYLVNPRGGDLGFGWLCRSGTLRSLVTMLHSLEATGGHVGALLAPDMRRTIAVVLTVMDAVRH